jgi:hypothetical protein
MADLGYRLFSTPFYRSRIDNILQRGRIEKYAIPGTNTGGYNNCVPTAFYYMREPTYRRGYAIANTEECARRIREGRLGFTPFEIINLLNSRRYPGVEGHVIIQLVNYDHIRHIFTSADSRLRLYPGIIALLLIYYPDGSGHLVNIFLDSNNYVYIFDGQIYFNHITGRGTRIPYLTSFNGYFRRRGMDPRNMLFSTVVQLNHRYNGIQIQAQELYYSFVRPDDKRLQRDRIDERDRKGYIQDMRMVIDDENVPDFKGNAKAGPVPMEENDFSPENMAFPARPDPAFARPGPAFARPDPVSMAFPDPAFARPDPVSMAFPGPAFARPGPVPMENDSNSNVEMGGKGGGKRKKRQTRKKKGKKQTLQRKK